MLHRRRGTVRDLRRENRAAVLWSLYFSRPGSRQDLSAATGLSPASVTNVVRELLRTGIVIEAGSEDSDGGRPRVLLDINPDGTVRDLRRENRAAVLWSLYFSRPGSRQDLSAATGLSPASVTNVVRELLEAGIVIEAGSEDPGGGRPRVLLDITPDSGSVIGVDIGEPRIRVEFFNLAMTERAKAEYPLNPAEHEVDVVVRDIAAGLNAVLADGGIEPAAVLGVGIGVPGIVEQGPDVLVHAQTYRWDAVPLERLL